MLKAYSTCVGAGPFVAENAVSEKWQQDLREAGGEFGAATGRPRRVGPFDAVASRYGLRCQHADKIALTKLDVLSSMKEIPIITGYNDPNGSLVEFDQLITLIHALLLYTKFPAGKKIYHIAGHLTSFLLMQKITLKQLRICFMQKSTLYLSVLREMNIY